MSEGRQRLPEDLELMPPGPGLAAALASVDRTALSSKDRIRLAQARNRLTAHVQGELYADLYAIGRTDRGARCTPPLAPSCRGTARRQSSSWTRGVGVGRRWRYRTGNDRELVRDELKALGVSARAAVIAAMKRHQRGELMPYEEEHLGGELHAIRVFLDGNTYRLLYAYEGSHDQVLLALHCIQKKDRKLPKRSQTLARKRLRDWRSRGGR